MKIENSQPTISDLLAAATAAYDLPADGPAWDDGYAAAGMAAAAAIGARLAEITPKLAVACTAADHDAPEEMGGGLYSHYTTDLTVGDRTETIGGWMICGWIQAGASADLDGSGLANWGSSQPGGWSCCDSDGGTRGQIEVTHTDYSVTVQPGYGREGQMEITVAGLLGLTDAEQAIIREHLNLADPLAGLAERIEAELESMDRGVEAPSAKDCWEAISGGTEVVDDAVRVGSWGDYPLVVIRDEKGDCAAYQAGDEDDWTRPVRKAAADSAEAEVARLVARMSED